MKLPSRRWAMAGSAVLCFELEVFRAAQHFGNANIASILMRELLGIDSNPLEAQEQNKHR
jgi:hypothetical protein